MTEKTKKQQGFGLLEILISMVIVGILGSSLVMAMKSQHQAVANGSDLTRGTHLAKKKLDSLRVSSYRWLGAGSDTVENKYIRAWYITTDNGKKEVQMKVFWPLTGEHSVKISALVSDDQYKAD